MKTKKETKFKTLNGEWGKYAAEQLRGKKPDTIKANTGNTPGQLYYHKTDGGAEYLFDTFIECENGHKEGVINDKTKYAIRLDGNAALLNAASDLLMGIETIAEHLLKGKKLQQGDAIHTAMFALIERAGGKFNKSGDRV